MPRLKWRRIQHWLFRAQGLYLLLLLIGTGSIIVFSYENAKAMRDLAVDSATRVAAEVAAGTEERALAAARVQLIQEAGATADRVSATLAEAVSVARTLAETLADLRSSGVTLQAGREGVTRLLRTVLSGNRGYFAVYSVWEPQAFDGDDEAHRNLSGHDASGRFAPYWYRSPDGELLLQPARYYEDSRLFQIDVRMGEYYLAVRESGQTQVIPPFLRRLERPEGERLSSWVVSLVVPVLIDEQFQGVVGIDLALADLEQRVRLEARGLYEGRGQVLVVSANGTIVASSRPGDQAGKHLSVFLPAWQAMLEDLRAEERTSRFTASQLMITTPLTLPGSAPWAVFVLLPDEVIREQAAVIEERLMADVRAVETSLEAESEAALWKQLLAALVLLLFAFFILRLMRELARKEQALRVNEERFRTMVENTSDWIWEVDSQGLFVYSSPALQKVLGFRPEEMLGRNLFDLVHRADIGQVRGRYQLLAQARKPFHGLEIVSLHRRGDEVVLESSGVPIYDRDGAFLGFRGISRDITERKRAEEEVLLLNTRLEERVQERTCKLQQANEALNESLRSLKAAQAQLVQSEKMAALGDMVAGIAHEVNNPLGVGVTAASYLRECGDEFRKRYQGGNMTRSDLERFLEQYAEALEMLHENLERASSLINNFKEVSVDQSHEEQRDFDLKAYLQKIRLSLHPKLKKTPHRLAIDCPEGLTLSSFPGAFSQIISNLVMNSLLHGFDEERPGKMHLSVSREGAELYLCYRDNGQGMAPEVLEHVFDPFMTTKRGQGGSGLGMHIVQTLVREQLGGEVSCYSAPGEGVEVRIRLPLVSGRADPPGSPE